MSRYDHKIETSLEGIEHLSKEKKEKWNENNLMANTGNEWKDAQKKYTNKRPSETRNRRKSRKKIINKIS